MKTYAIEGMHCAACATSVEKAVNKLDGINEASVNQLTEKVSVDFDESKLSLDDISKAVSDAGYTLVTQTEPARSDDTFKTFL